MIQPTPAGAALADAVRDVLRRFGEPAGADEAIFRDVVESEAADARDDERTPIGIALRLLARKIKEKRFELKERVLELESLYDLGLAVAGTLDLERLADEILLRSISLTNSRYGSLLLRESHGAALARSFGREILGAEAAQGLRIPADGLINNQASTLPTAGVRLSGCEKCLVVPIQIEGRTVGYLAVADKETREGGIADFVAADARLLSLFANQAATAIETARLHRTAIEKDRLEREMELAATIQQKILPRGRPVVPGLQLAAANRPTRHVGGDYYDFFPLADNRFGFVVADVSGKGVPAALLVSTLASAVHLQLDEARDLAHLAGRINRHLYRFSEARKFVTLFFGRVEPATGLLEYVSAGHNPAYVARRGGGIDLLPATGRPLGMFSDTTWELGTRRVEPGDRLCVYTDGMTEAQNPNQEEFGSDRLQQLLAYTLQDPIQSAADSILGAVSEFAAGEPQYDDQTLLLLSRESG